MRVLVTGAGGQLGRSIRDCASGAPDEYVFADSAALDVSDRDAVAEVVGNGGFDVIVNCAAYTAVDRAEDEPEAARRVNAKAPAILAGVARDSGATLVHVSTDYVFGSSCANTPITELCAPAPDSVYGITKLEGERAVTGSGAKAIIIRTGWLYSEYGRNFLLTMIGLTASRPSLNVVFDQVGTPTYAADLAAFIVGMISRRQLDRTGIYHYADEGVCSWYDFACTIAAMVGNTGCDICPCHTSEYPAKAPRPAYSVLDKTKAKATFGAQIPHWADSLARCIANLKNEIQ